MPFSDVEKAAVMFLLVTSHFVQGVRTQILKYKHSQVIKFKNVHGFMSIVDMGRNILNCLHFPY